MRLPACLSVCLFYIQDCVPFVGMMDESGLAFLYVIIYVAGWSVIEKYRDFFRFNRKGSWIKDTCAHKDELLWSLPIQE